jgi:hypothetical protein
MLGEIRVSDVLPSTARAELIGVLEEIERSRMFGRNPLTDRAGEILTEHAEFSSVFAAYLPKF